MLGDHRFDDQLDEMSSEARDRSRAFSRGFLAELQKIDREMLSRDNQVDFELLRHRLQSSLWRSVTLQEWAWNPLVYTRLAGDAVYGLMSREFAPKRQRLGHVAARLEQFPRLFRQVRATLLLPRVPRIHAETAIKQNRGVLSILDNMVRPELDILPDKERRRLEAAMEVAQAAVEEHQAWLETQVLENAGGQFRIGQELYDRKLGFSLHTPLTRQQIRARAESELKRVRNEMFRIAQQVYKQKHPWTNFPQTPSHAYQQALIRAALEMAYLDIPQADQIVETAQRSLQLTTDFIRQQDLVTIPSDPLEIIVMPEFRRGVSLAYCDSPGPLDVGQKTFYAVAPPPADWTAEQVQSFLREYNVRSVHDLTIHEAMPGHFLQIAHSNRYPGRLRSVLTSGTFIEGWAVYAEQMMAEEGFLDNDPLMRLIAHKWYLRGIANAMIDQAIHTAEMTRDQAMKLMIEDTFQEEREAAAKWIRAQLTSAQLSTYFVGYLEHVDMRRQAEQAWGTKFKLKQYHDKALSFGSPPVMFVQALLLGTEIPQ